MRNVFVLFTLGLYSFSASATVLTNSYHFHAETNQNFEWVTTVSRDLDGQIHYVDSWPITSYSSFSADVTFPSIPPGGTFFANFVLINGTVMPVSESSITHTKLVEDCDGSPCPYQPINLIVRSYGAVIVTTPLPLDSSPNPQKGTIFLATYAPGTLPGIAVTFEPGFAGRTVTLPIFLEEAGPGSVDFFDGVNAKAEFRAHGPSVYDFTITVGTDYVPAPEPATVVSLVGGALVLAAYRLKPSAVRNFAIPSESNHR